MDRTELAYKLENPSNTSEQARLDLQHQVWLLTLEGSLRAPSIPNYFKPRSVLDVGCGSGTWAIAYAQNDPECEVIGIDITPPVIQDHPSNLSIVPESVDAERESQWPRGRTFDYIHLRMLTLALRDYSTVLRICWDYLRPGGWIEIDDAHYPYEAENVTANVENSIFLRASYLQIQAQKNNGIDAMASHHHVDRLKLLGFTEVSQTKFKWPVNGCWPEDEKHKRIGTMTGSNWQQMWGKYGPIILSTKLSMSQAEAMDICNRVLQECKDDREMHCYFPVGVTTAQKPAAPFEELR